MQSQRAGVRITQNSGYKAFIPNPLPPDPALKIDDEMQTLLSKADRALGRLDGSIQTLPNPDLFALMYIRKEAVLSSQIEGTQSSLDDVLEAEANVFDPAHPSDVGEVINYVAAMSYGLERLKSLPVSIRLIREIHNELLHNVRGQERNPGEIRNSQNWIGPAGCTINEAIFVPPPPHEIQNSLGDLENFIHSNTQIPFLIKVGLIHAQFETIHPFLDGNGRVGRLLITFLLCENEILTDPVLYISHYFKKYRNQYYEYLQGIRDEGNWEEWIKFFLNGVASVSLEATDTARKIVAMREEHRKTIVSNFGRRSGSALTILEDLFLKPITTVKEISDKLEVTFPAANSLVNEFVEAGLLHEITGQERYRVFRYSPYVALFG